MKLIIDIPDYTYALILSEKNGAYFVHKKDMVEWIKKGTRFDSFPDREKGEQLYSDLLRVKHNTMSIDSLIDKVYADMRGKADETNENS